jgi:phosphate starvation-inducible PhoH-like protein
MIEKSIFLEGIDPIEIYGANNVNLNKIKDFFPKLKILARGDELKIQGDTDEISIFIDKFNLVLKHFHKYNSINEKLVERIIFEDTAIVEQMYENADNILVFGNNGKSIKPRNAHQVELIEKMVANDLVFAIGPAGTGKTYIAIAMAIRALRKKAVRKIILSRPAVEAEEKLGFLPGDLKDKLDPYLQPLYDALRDMIPARKLEEYIKDGIIQIAPLAYMRGRTLSHAFVILDEAQNTTQNQMKMFLTRMGEGSKFVITGDVTQIDLPQRIKSGLVESLKLLQNVNGIATIAFDQKDIIRHNLVRDIVNAYAKLVNNVD